MSTKPAILRRNWLAQIAVMTTVSLVRSVVANSIEKSANTPRIGLCTFSCHRHWQAVRDRHQNTKFSDAPSFIDYVNQLGAQGIQTSVSELSDEQLRGLREALDKRGHYFEGDVQLPADDATLGRFEHDIEQCHAAGATVARTVLLSGRRYETFKTRTEFEAFHQRCLPRLRQVEPILKRHNVKLAVENHKDLTTDEFLTLLNQCDGDWIGINVDTGNNLALLEEPHEVINRLAPRVLSVHLKDMAVQSDPRGFLLSEVPLGTGLLDLPRVLSTLAEANSQISFSLEMATRDPLVVPCLNDAFWTTMPDLRESRVAPMLEFVKANPPKGPTPSIKEKTLDQQLADEETNNRTCLDWYQHQSDVEQ